MYGKIAIKPRAGISSISKHHFSSIEHDGRAVIKIELYISKEMLEYLRAQPYNKYAKSKSEIVRNALDEVKETIFRIRNDKNNG